jgi:hypothetical protein
MLVKTMTEYINIKSRNKEEDELFRIFKSAMKRKNISLTDSFITSMIFIAEFCEKSEKMPEVHVSPKISAIFERYKELHSPDKNSKI